MHIPDGYLSPVTCAVTYAVTIPFWYMAFQRVQRLLHTKMVPMLALFAAFSFVIMMFNIPLPGGTTGHATGIAITSIVLGPWASIVAISIALLIQAVFFGDGGITSYAANCLNMAVIGSFTAHWVYTLLAGTSSPDSKLRVFAAAVAAYLAINLAAFFTAIEFGIQPLLFVDATGTPLYAPYSLQISLPAMMLGHLSIAGLAELLITVGLVTYLQRNNPELLILPSSPKTPTSAWKKTRKLWFGLAALMIISPLGLLAAGSAWGEWAADDFNQAHTREEIMRTSAQIAPPPQAPVGLEKLSQVWTAPIPDYAPSFMHNANYGYILSALLGSGLILLLLLLISALLSKRTVHEQQPVE